MSRRGAVCRAALLAAALGCEETAPPPPTPRRQAPAPAHSDVKRPSKVWYLQREDRRCVIFWVDGDAESVRREDLCPRDLERGERIRLAGRSCMRESNDDARNVPVRCPYTMVVLADEPDGGLAKDGR